VGASSEAPYCQVSEEREPEERGKGCVCCQGDAVEVVGAFDVAGIDGAEGVAGAG
jgi:hypothetical protein